MGNQTPFHFGLQDGRVIQGGNPVPPCRHTQCRQRVETPLGIILCLCRKHLDDQHRGPAKAINLAAKSGSYRFLASHCGTREELLAELRASLKAANLLPPGI